MSRRSPQRSTRTLTLRRVCLLCASCAVGAVGWFLLGESEALSAEQAGVDSPPGAFAEHPDRLRELFVVSLRAELVELEARRRGVSREALLAAEVEARLDEISETEVLSFYEARRALLRRPLEEIEPLIREHLAYEAFVTRLESRHFLPSASP